MSCDEESSSIIHLLFIELSAHCFICVSAFVVLTEGWLISTLSVIPISDYLCKGILEGVRDVVC